MPTYLSPGVYVEEIDSGSRPIEGVGTAVAAFIGLAEKGPFNQPTLISNWTQFTATFGGFIEGACLAESVFAYFQNGGGNSYIVRIGDTASSNGSAPKAIAAAVAQGMLANLRVMALDPAAPADSIKVEVVEYQKDAGEGQEPTKAVKLVVSKDGKVVEEHLDVTTARGKTNVVTVVNADSQVIRLEQISGRSALDLQAGTDVVLAPPADAIATPPERLTGDDYIGDAADRTGVSGLEAIDEITMVCMPDLMTAYQRGAIDLDTVQSVQTAMIAHCELMGDRMAILDPPPGLNAQQIKEWRVDKARYDSKYATLYWPWVSTKGGDKYLPPSGFIAGIWGRNDDTRGVHKAPANEIVRGAIALETQITRKEHDLLNPVGINCIRAFPARGIRVWGARTLSSDPAWRYVNIRRLFNYLEESILQNTDWVVFEPNDHALWAKLRRTISAFLVNEWRKGALFGLTPDDAFFVKCDEETNPTEGIDVGEVVCVVGVAPVKPAEFVIFRLSQFSGGTSLVAE
ncbi:phage tail sheath subtilisin-like domain-containing protein [Mycolicibacterium sp. lyk4-40-TYG-92]|jgi:phage tail sheath protein FI|uniref:phage tail sheath family protein n=1 Tax=Mycolicibacterium sp. lyk4-40-TYG-92 TaxID=3040295 RepID=UPI002550FB29|nr:phage tail sheath subtilisin-like domain-containing protein [Mycolicibacterium sp. lyk4-40-TYG-92]